MSRHRHQQQVMKGVLSVMASRSQRERLEVTRLEDSLKQAQQQHQQRTEMLEHENSRYREGRVALSEQLRTQTRSVADLNRYQSGLNRLNAAVSTAESERRRAASAESDAETKLDSARALLRDVLLREEKWRIAYRSLAKGGGYENG